MSRNISDAFEHGKKLGLRLVVILTVSGTIYSSIFKTEEEARDYYTILQPVVEDASEKSEIASERAVKNSLDIAELKGLIDGLQRCQANLSSKPDIEKSDGPKSKKSSGRMPDSSSPPPPDPISLPPPSAGAPGSSMPSRANNKMYLPKRPWEQNINIEQVERLIEKRLK